MDAVRPNPDFVIARLNYLIQDPKMDSVINKNYNEARRRTAITTLAVAALTCVGYLYTRSYITLGVGILVLFMTHIAGQRALNTAKVADNHTKEGRFQAAIEGIKEAFQSGRASKQDLGIKVLNGKEISWNSLLLGGTPKGALDYFEKFYNHDGFANENPDIFAINSDPKVSTYRKILPIAKQFLSCKTGITPIKELQNEAYKFIYGYPSPNFNEVTKSQLTSVDKEKMEGKGYLDVSVVNDKIVANAWPDA